MSVAKTLANLNGKKVIRRITGTHTVETVDKFKAELIGSIEANKENLAKEGLSLEDFKDEGDKFTLGRYFWFKPKMKAVETGVFHLRSADYYFVPEGKEEGVFGSKKGFTYSPELNKVEKPMIMGNKANNGALISFELVD